MKRIIQKISEQYEGYSLLKYLKLVQPNWTKVFAIKMIRTSNVLINNKKVPINYKLQTGDTIEFYGYSQENTSTINLSKLRPLQVVYEDSHILIVNKEIGIVVQEDESNTFNNMNNRLLKHLNWKQEERSSKWQPTFIHRLDRNTTGLLIGAKTYKAYIELTNALKEGKIEKYYITKVHGLVPFKTKLVRNYLLKNSNTNRVKQVDKETPKAKEAISEIKLIKHLLETKESLLEIKLITGRTHQIRVHLSGLGFPIRGDQKYGIEKNKKTYPYPFLKAYKLVFSEDLEGKTISQLKGKTFSLDNH